MIVVDASVLVPALADDGVHGEVARARLVGERLVAPALVDLEVTSVLRGLALKGSLGIDRATAALADLIDLPVERVDHRQLVGRCWELRDNLTPYDAAYVALAEHLEVPLVTADERLSRASGIRCDIEVVHAH